MWSRPVCAALLALLWIPHARADETAAARVFESDSALYRLSLNTGWLELTPAELMAVEGADFASDFYLDWHARQANLRLTGLDGELAIAADLRARRLRLRLAGGHMGTLFLRLDSDIALKGKPEIDARLLVAIAGYQLKLDLPRVRIAAKWRRGQLQMEYMVPLIQGGF